LKNEQGILVPGWQKLLIIVAEQKWRPWSADFEMLGNQAEVQENVGFIGADTGGKVGLKGYETGEKFAQNYPKQRFEWVCRMRKGSF